MIDLKNASSKEIASYFSRKTNDLLFKPDIIAQEQKDSKHMKDLDIYWIKILSSRKYRTDLRNEASARTARKLADIPFVMQQIALVSNQKMETVADKMAMDHRSKIQEAHIL